LLIVNVAKMMITNFLKEEKSNLERISYDGKSITIKFLEQRLEKLITLDIAGESTDVRLKGFVDRVDEMGGHWRIIDYKTGDVDKKELDVKEWTDLRTLPELDKSFQLLTYTYLLSDKLPKDKLYEAGIISLRKVKTGFLPVSVPCENPGNKIDQQVLSAFEEVLLEILAEIFDPAVPFDQTTDLDVCNRCPFINLCGR
jgi:ATP-dependent helicase/nuclease subunit B